MYEFFSIPSKLPPDVNFGLLIISGLVLLVICVRLIMSKNLLESIIIMSVFSIIISICYLLMDAPDVAMTEVALGACLSTCVLLNLVKIFGEDVGSKVSKTRFIFAIVLCVVFVGLLVMAGLELPLFGDGETQVQSYLTKYYVENTNRDIGIPSFVAAILASYRGYDTLGETSVILVAGLAVVLILAKKRRN